MKRNETVQTDQPAADAAPALEKTPPLWLAAGITLLLTSLMALVYFYFKKGAGPKTPPVSEPAISKPAVPDPPRSEPVLETPLEKVVPEPAPSFAPLRMEQVMKLSGPVLALGVAYFAQGIFGSTIGEGGMENWIWLGGITISNRLWLGTGLYLLALLTWAMGAPAVHSPGSALQPVAPEVSRPRSLPRTLLIGSLGIYVLSILMFLTGGETGLVRVLWAVGLICFIASQLPLPGMQADAHLGAEGSPRFRWQDWLLLAFVLGAAFWLRFYKLALIPDDFHGDMASYGEVARSYLTGDQKEIFGYAYSGIPLMAFFPGAFSMAVFGINIFGLQMSAVLGGMFSLLAIYLLVWRLFNSHRLALLTTVLVTINVVHIHFSRIAFCMDPWPFGYFALFFLVDGLKARRPASFGLAGVFLGFCLQMYFPGRVLAFIIGFFLIHAFFHRRSWITENLPGLALMLAGTLVAMGPALAFHLTHWDVFVQRAREVFIFAPGEMGHLLNKYNTTSPFMVLLTQIKLTLLMFNQSGDTSSHVGFPHPMFNFLVSPLIVLGLGSALRRWKDAGMFMALIWLALMAVLGSILTVDAPPWPHLVGIVPAAALLIAVALDQLIELVGRVFDDQARILISVLLVIFLVMVGVINWDQYHQTVKDNGSITTMIGRYIGSLPEDVTACSLVSGTPLAVRETAFLAWPRKLVDIQPDAPDSSLDDCTGDSLVWVISPENIGRLNAVRERWTDGVVQNYTFPHYDYTLTFYLVNVDPPVIPAK